MRTASSDLTPTPSLLAGCLVLTSQASWSEWHQSSTRSLTAFVEAAQRPPCRYATWLLSHLFERYYMLDTSQPFSSASPASLSAALLASSTRSLARAHLDSRPSALRWSGRVHYLVREDSPSPFWAVYSTRRRGAGAEAEGRGGEGEGRGEREQHMGQSGESCVMAFGGATFDDSVC
jgi:hypothetical protein